jgi:hypothetical protein
MTTGALRLLLPDVRPTASLREEDFVRMFFIAANEEMDRPFIAPEFNSQPPPGATSPIDRILRLAPDSWASRMLSRAFELGLFGELSARPLDAEALRRRLGLPQPGVRNFFDSLVTLGLIERRSGRYSNVAQMNFRLGRARLPYGAHGLNPAEIRPHARPRLRRFSEARPDAANRPDIASRRIRQSAAAKAGRVPQQGDKIDA